MNDMKKKVFLLFTLLFSIFSVNAQSVVENTGSPKALKPIIMVVPEKAWCINHGFVRMITPRFQITRKHFSMMRSSMW